MDKKNKVVLPYIIHNVLHLMMLEIIKIKAVYHLIHTEFEKPKKFL